MNRVIQIWRSKGLDIIDEDTIKTRIIRLIENADSLGKSTRDLKKPTFVTKIQAQYDKIFDIAATPVKVKPTKTASCEQSVEMVIIISSLYFGFL